MSVAKPKVRMPERILREEAVLEFTGLSPTQIADQIKDGTFPKPIKIGERAKGWLESELRAWLEARIAERDEKAA